MKRILLLAAAVLAAGSIYAGQYPDIKIAEVKSAIKAKTVTLIDVNGTESWQKGHIPGAIDFEGAKGKLASLLPKDKSALVVAYCGGPMCQAYQAGAKAAEKLGYTNVKHLTAGISGWLAAGEPVQKGKTTDQAKANSDT